MACTPQGKADWWNYDSQTVTQCGEGGKSGAPDWGARAPDSVPECDQGSSGGARDWGDYAPVSYPLGGDGAQAGAPDWGDYAVIPYPLGGDGALSGLPDWGALAPDEEGLSVATAQELLARRLGLLLPVPAGTPWLYDDFEGTPLKWAISNNGVGSSGALSTAGAVSGSQSLLLTCGAAVGAFSQANIYIPYPNNKQVAIMVLFSAVSGDEELTIKLHIEDGARRSIGYVVWDFGSGAYDIQDTAANSLQAGTQVAVGLGGGSYSLVELAINHDTEKLSRAVLDDQLLSIDSDIAAVADTGAKQINATIQYTNINGVGDAVYIGDVIISHTVPGL